MYIIEKEEKSELPTRKNGWTKRMRREASNGRIKYPFRNMKKEESFYHEFSADEDLRTTDNRPAYMREYRSVKAAAYQYRRMNCPDKEFKLQMVYDSENHMATGVRCIRTK